MSARCVSKRARPLAMIDHGNWFNSLLGMEQEFAHPLIARSSARICLPPSTLRHERYYSEPAGACCCDSETSKEKSLTMMCGLLRWGLHEIRLSKIPVSLILPLQSAVSGEKIACMAECVCTADFCNHNGLRCGKPATFTVDTHALVNKTEYGPFTAG